MPIQRINPSPRMSRAVVHGDTIYLTPDKVRMHRFGADGKAMAQ